VWQIDEALDLVRLLQPLTRQFNYHLALGGSVLNRGRSDKDLDIYFLPLDNGDEVQPRELENWLGEVYGPAKRLSGEAYKDDPSAYRSKVQLTHCGKRIDAFIM
jgi:hypothetical protein